MTKTCGECNSWNKHTKACVFHEIDMDKTNPTCGDFAQKNNGDVIRQMSNAALARVDKCEWCAFFDGLCHKKSNQSCADGIEPYLNAPAEREGEDE